MASKQNDAARGRATRLARIIREIGAEIEAGRTTPFLTGEQRDALEVAAILLEQTSVSRYNKARAAFNAAHGRFVRRQTVGVEEAQQ